jgi:hypothetical protein
MEYIVTYPQLSTFLKRRFPIKELEELVNTIKHKSGNDGTIDDMVLYDEIRQFIASKRNNDLNNIGTEQDYWDSYLAFETPLILFVKSSLNK